MDEKGARKKKGTDLLFIILPGPTLLSVLDTPTDNRLDLVDEALAAG